MKFRREIAGLAVSVLLGFAGVARADTLPVVKLVSGTAIDPTSADNYYNSANPNGAAAHTAGLCGLKSIMCNLPRALPLQALARSLSRNGAATTAQFTQNVYEYIYKNIDTEFRYGLSKGAFGALLDQSGTPFDQANLMVELLRQGGVTASYQTGTITLTAAQFQAWTGLTSAQAACQYLANGGIPLVVNGSSNCASVSGPVTSVTMAHIWVVANSASYDPSFKSYIQIAGLNLPSVLGCGSQAAPTCGSQALATAIPASSQGYDSAALANYVQNVQYAALGTTLNGFAQNLQHYIEQHYPSANVQDIVGGWKIDPAAAPANGAVLPYTVAQTQHSWSGDIPDQYRSRLTIQFNGINAVTYADETAGYWLYIGGSNYAPSGSWIQENTLFLERERNNVFPATPGATESDGSTNEVVPLVSVSLPLTSSYGTVTLTAQHPYAAAGGSYMRDTFSKSIFFEDFSSDPYWGDPNKSPFFIVQSWGRTGRGSVQRASAMAASKSPIEVERWVAGTAFASSADYIPYSVMLPATVGTWLAEAGQAAAINDGLAQTRTQEHHTFGVATEAQNDGAVAAQGLDAWTSMSVASTNGSATVQPSFAATVAAYNALEGGAVEQLNDTPDGQSAVRWFQMTNSQNNRFYQATPSNISSVLSHTTNYNVQVYGDPKQFIQGYFGSGSTFNMVVPKNGIVGTWGNNGTTMTYAYGPALAYSSDGTQIGYVTTNGEKGASFMLTAPDPTVGALAEVGQTKPAKPLNYTVSAESGALTMSMNPDLVTGSGAFPYSLSYQRFYNADDIPSQFICLSTAENEGAAPQESCTLPALYHLAGGWSDNYQIRGMSANDGARGLGSDMGLEASSAITALYTLQNLAASPSFNGYISQIFVASWLSDQLQGNSVVVKRPPDTATFMLLPDGRYNPRPGAGGQLTQTGVRARFLGGSGFIYDYTGISFSLTEKSGSILAFTPAFQNLCLTRYSMPGNLFLPRTWSFSDGASLKFTFSGNVSGFYACMDIQPTLTVTNNLGRSLIMARETVSDPAGYTNNAIVVTDDNGRKIHVSDKQPANTWQSDSNWSPISIKVTLVDGAQEMINYVPTSGFSGDYVNSRLTSLYLPANPNGAYLTFAYDAIDRITTVTDAVNNVTNYFPGQVSGEQMAKGVVVDPLGNATTSYFDGGGRTVEVIDPLQRVSVKAYDDIGRLTLDANPLLGCSAYIYDVRGNTLQTSRYPAGGCSLSDPGNGQLVALSGSPGTPITETASYGFGSDSSTASSPSAVYACATPATCNVVASQTDGRGATSSYTYNAGTGQLATLIKPADSNGATPETDLYYTSYAGVSLLTSKTDWIAKGGSPSSVTTAYTYDSTNHYALNTATVDSGTGGLKLRTCFKLDVIGNLVSVSDPRAASCP